MENGTFQFLGYDPGQDFGNRVDLNLTLNWPDLLYPTIQNIELEFKVFVNCKLGTKFKIIKIPKK